jgi:hypothetical protein
VGLDFFKNTLQVLTILGQEPSVQLVVDLDEEPIWVEAGVTIFSATLK